MLNVIALHEPLPPQTKQTHTTELSQKFHKEPLTSLKVMSSIKLPSIEMDDLMGFVETKDLLVPKLQTFSTKPGNLAFTG